MRSSKVNWAVVGLVLASILALVASSCGKASTTTSAKPVTPSSTTTSSKPATQPSTTTSAKPSTQPSTTAKPGQTVYLRMAVTEPGGSSYTNGAIVAALSNKYNKDIVISVIPERSAADAMNLFSQGKIDIALGSAKTSWQAATSVGPYAGKAPIVTRATWHGWAQNMHILVPKNSSIQSLTDLKGKRLGVAEVGVLSNDYSVKLLKAAGIDAAKDLKMLPGTTEDSIRALKDKTVDAAMRMFGVPSPVFEEAFLSQDLRLIPISNDVFKAFVQILGPEGEGRFSYQATIPKGIYKGVDQDVPSFTITSGFFVSPNMDADIMYRITKEVWGHYDEAVAIHSLAKIWKSLLPTPIDSSAPRHPGVEKALKELNLIK